MFYRPLGISSVLAVASAMIFAGPAASPAHAQPTKAEKIPGLPDNAVLPAIPANAREVSTAMKAAKAGDPVILHGRVAGSKDAFVENVAAFTLVDEAEIKPATSKGLADTAADIATESKCVIQFVNKAGKPFPVDLTFKAGLKPGTEVFVVGTVLSALGADAAVVNATGIHIPKSSLPVGFFLETAPDAVKDLSDAKKAGGFKVGDTVTFRGRIGGSTEPFIAGRAMFTLMGSGLKDCSQNPGDNCTKPWDYCCETKKDILAHSATIRVVDDKGQPMKTDFKGRRGLRELTPVVVIGKVAFAEGQALVLNATGMFVEVE